MPDLAPAGAGHATDLADRIGREIVVQQEIAAEIAMQGVDDLFVVAGSQRGHHQRLGFAAREQGRAMRPRQEAHFAFDRAHRPGVAAVDPGTAIDDIAAQDGRFQLFQRRAQIRILQILIRQSVPDLRLDRSNRVLAVGLVLDRIGRAHVSLAQRLHAGIKRAVIGRLEVERLFRRGLGQIDDQVDHGLHRLVAEFDRTQHLVLGQLIGFRFDHHHGVLGARHDQIQPLLGVAAQPLHVLDVRVQNIFAIDEPDPRRADRAHERNARDRQRGTGGDHRDDVGVIDQIVAQHGAHDQHFVLEARREQRSAGTVDQTRGQRLFLGRARLALEETARHLAGGIVFFLVVDRQREKVLSRLRFLGEGHIGHHAGLAQGGDHAAIGLTGDLARFQRQGILPPLDRFLHIIKHLISS